MHNKMDEQTYANPHVHQITEILPESTIFELHGYLQSFFNDIRINANHPRMERILIKYILNDKSLEIGVCTAGRGFKKIYHNEKHTDLTEQSLLVINRVNEIFEHISSYGFMNKKKALNIYYQHKKDKTTIIFSGRFMDIYGYSDYDTYVYNS